MPKQKQPHNKTVREVLEYAARCVEYGHAKRVLARNRNGKEVDARSQSAESWCAIGAIFRSTQDVALGEEAQVLLRKQAAVDGSVGLWNDAPGRTQSQVVAALRAAAKAAR